jgi:hypothetical protein
MTLFLLLFACGDRANDTRDTEVTPECTEDVQCEAVSICSDANTCVLGDRDNDIQSATTVFKTTDPEDSPSAEGVIQTRGDVDYYAFEAIEPQWVRIQTVSEFPEELDTVVAVLDASGGIHAWVDDFATGSINLYDSVLHAYLPTAGTWYVTVQDRGTWFNLDEEAYDRDLSYQLSILDFSNTTIETDAADNPSADIDITSGSSIYTVGVNLEEAGDVDYISVQIPYGDAPIEVYGLNELPGSDARIRVTLTDDAGTVLSDKRDLGEDGSAAYFGAPAGTYTLEATDGFDGGGTDHWFPLYVRSRAEGDHYTLEVEPNDAENVQALPVEPLTTDSGLRYNRVWMQGALGETDDEDWFEMPATIGDRLTIRCDGSIFGSTGDLQLELMDGGGAVVATATDGNDDMPDLENFGPISADDTYTMRLFNENEAEFGASSFYRCIWFATTFEIAEN